MKRVLALLFAVFISGSILMVPAAAAANASDYIASAYATLEDVSNGYLLMSYRVVGTGVMDSIGATTVKVQENNGSGWRVVKTYTVVDDPYMVKRDAFSYTYHLPQYYKGVEGYSYCISVAIYAEDSTGADTVAVSSNVVVVK